MWVIARALAAHGEDGRRVRGVGLELLAQAGDADVDAVVAGAERPAVGGLGQAVAREHLARVAGEGGEKLVLHRGERHLDAGGLLDKAVGVEVEGAAAEAVAAGRRW